MTTNAWPYARKHPSWPDALRLIEASGLRGHIAVGRRSPGVYHAIVSRAVPMEVQTGEGPTPYEAVAIAMGRAQAALA